mmetsp:Transcript_19338/g.73063  ORF Transcript_19338/g.73063 Transcript_19338/m.73063 type:complete len:83 (-) Transcript_19338:873-1121(-)
MYGPNFFRVGENGCVHPLAANFHADHVPEKPIPSAQGHFTFNTLPSSSVSKSSDDAIRTCTRCSCVVPIHTRWKEDCRLSYF